MHSHVLIFICIAALVAISAALPPPPHRVFLPHDEVEAYRSAVSSRAATTTKVTGMSKTHDQHGPLNELSTPLPKKPGEFYRHGPIDELSFPLPKMPGDFYRHGPIDQLSFPFPQGSPVGQMEPICATYPKLCQSAAPEPTPSEPALPKRSRLGPDSGVYPPIPGRGRMIEDEPCTDGASLCKRSDHHDEKHDDHHKHKDDHKKQKPDKWWKPATLNCKGSSGCHNLFSFYKSHNMREIFDSVMMVDLNRHFADGELIACSDHICAFPYKTGTGITGAAARNLLFKLLGRCNVCGRVPANLEMSNLASNAELRVDQVLNQYPAYCVGLCYLGNRTETIMAGRPPPKTHPHYWHKITVSTDGDGGKPFQ